MILEAILKRRSVRSYQNKDVEEEKLKEVLEAGRLAPSACNIQPWKFIVVRDPETRKKMASHCANQKFVSEAPVLIVGCITERGYLMGGWYDSNILDLGIALDHMTLQAVHLGLGTCWIGAFNESEVKKLLNIPHNVRVGAILTLGYPKNGNVFEKDRKPFEEVISFEKFS
ncbi:nitroreductase family protein [Caldisericum exile]|uniref:NADH dehydrogenase n=1 Tax=Caldisericum exile (strain DSM 21853 / NBRC 104410 / AZM16c01) TaxID=511051 RepID=A0A7U6GE83_CALEA|nr:nitroreductase family protein [Caldisericum exile]BAL80755.1 putative NADH dehydrogenase [Caldisericum exile AZM16c01]